MGIARTHQTGPGTPGSPEVPFQAAVPEVPFQAAIPPVPAMPRMEDVINTNHAPLEFNRLASPMDNIITIDNGIPAGGVDTEDILTISLDGIPGFTAPSTFTTTNPAGDGTGIGILAQANRVSIIDNAGVLFLSIEFNSPSDAFDAINNISGAPLVIINLGYVTAPATAFVPGVPEVPFQAAIPEVPFQAAVPANPSHLPTLDAGEGGVVIAIVSTETGMDANKEQTDPLTFTIGSGASLTTLPLRVGSLLPGNAVVSSVELETFHIIVDS